MRELYIRPVLPEDRPAVEAIAAQIWDGEDYLPAVFDAWVADEVGGFWLGLLGERPVGVCKLTAFAPGFWWMEGLRVDPAYQGQGIGAKLYHHLVGQALERGPGVVRYSTASDNRVVVDRLAPNTGFLRMAAFAPYGGPANAQEQSGLIPLGEADWDRIWAFLGSRAPHFAMTNRTLEYSWRFLPLNEALLRERLASGLVFSWDSPAEEALSALAILNGAAGKGHQGPQTRLYAGYVDAVESQVTAFAGALLAFAAESQMEGISMKLVNDPALLAAFEAAGYERRWDNEVYLYERRIS